MATNTEPLASVKIALVHENLTIRGGAEKVLHELHKIFPNAPIYTPLYKKELFPEFKNATVITSGFNRWSFFRNRQQLLTPLMPYAVEQFDLSEYEMVISISTSAAKGALTRPETVHICYCNTPMRWAWLPHLDPRASGSFVRRLSAHYLRQWDSASASRVDQWIGNSQTVADRIRKFYQQEAEVIYPPVAVSEKQVVESKGEYYLSVCRLEDIKRVDVLVEAAKLAGFPLKVVGRGALDKVLREQAKGYDNIEFLGYVSDSEKEELYRNCKAFLFASEEDFGIVPIEAMSYGRPVIAFGRGGASETVIHKKTGVHFDAQTPESLNKALELFATLDFDPKEIAEHAQSFSEAAFHKNMTQFVEKTLKEHKQRFSLS